MAYSESASLLSLMSASGCGVLGVAVTDSVAVLETPLNVAVIIALAAAVRSAVLTAKFTEVAPIGTVIVLGTEATDGALLDSVITVSSGAGPVTVTVPVEAVPPATLLGFNVSVERVTPEVIVMTILEDTP